MKIDLSTIDQDQFMCHTHLVGNEMVTLVQPRHIGAVWDGINDIFRSSVWDMDGNLVSASFKKFVNWGEKPAIYPVPTSLKGAHLMEKVDGSTLIFSRWKGNTIVRTRGTVDARKQENGYEIDFLMAKYHEFVDMLESETDIDVSYIFEWQSPTNVIVINYGVEPDMVLTGIVLHPDYSYATQSALDKFADAMDLRRPQTYSYDSIEEMKAAVEAFKGVEGVCIYFQDDQKILKVKGMHYLLCHRMKSEVSSVEKVIDLWFAQGRPSYQEFYKFIADTFDHELAVMCQGNISNVCDAWKGVQPILTGFASFVEKVKHLSRREAAEKILQAYGQTNRAAFVFSLLDGKALNNDQLKKLLYQVIKVK